MPLTSIKYLISFALLFVPEHHFTNLSLLPVVIFVICFHSSSLNALSPSTTTFFFALQRSCAFSVTSTCKVATHCNLHLAFKAHSLNSLVLRKEKEDAPTSPYCRENLREATLQVQLRIHQLSLEFAGL